MKYFRFLYVQVLLGIATGIFVGWLFPSFSPIAKVISEMFINMIRMVIAPVIFFTLVLGIVGAGDLKKVGRVGGKGIVYFELLKNQILLDKILYLNYISDKMSANDFRCNWRFKVAIAPRKSVLIEGEKFEADIFIVSYPVFGSHISYTVDDSELLVEDGVSSFSKIESGIGLKTHNAKATIKNPVTGESLTSNAEFQYHVLPKCSQNCQ